MTNREVLKKLPYVYRQLFALRVREEKGKVGCYDYMTDPILASTSNALLPVIGGAFSWDTTPEGSDFWYTIALWDGTSELSVIPPHILKELKTKIARFRVKDTLIYG